MLTWNRVVGHAYAALLVASFAAAQTSAPASQAAASHPRGVARLIADAEALAPLAKSPLVERFLKATAELPAIESRTLYFDPEKKAFLSKPAFDALAQDARKSIRVRECDEDVYYNTKYGSPLAYSRALDLLAAAGLADVRGKRILDFGYGTVGHLRLLAALGADAVGVDVDPFLRELYCKPGDTGEVAAKDGKPGRVTLVDGRWPAEEPARKSVGGEFDLFISKNTLKRGYIHPASEVDPRMLVNLGVSDEEYLKAVALVLKPGALAMIYNICPAPTPPGPGYKPHSDGRCPFERELIEKCGFRVLEFNNDDTEATQTMARVLGWDKGPGAMDVDNDLTALYTLLQRTK